MAIQDYKKSIEFFDGATWRSAIYLGRPLNSDIGAAKHWVEFQNDKGAWITSFATDDQVRNQGSAVANAVINVYPDGRLEAEVDEATADAKAAPDRTSKTFVYVVNGVPKFETRPIDKADVQIDEPIDVEPVVKP